MELLGHILFAGFWATVAGLAGFVLGFLLTMWTDTCDPSVYTCDLAPIAGVGTGLILGAVVALVTGWVTFRRTTRGTPREVALNDQGHR